MGFRRIDIHVLVCEPVGHVKYNKDWGREPHGPGVDVVAHGLCVSVNGGIDGKHLQKDLRLVSITTFSDNRFNDEK